MFHKLRGSIHVHIKLNKSVLIYNMYDFALFLTLSRESRSDFRYMRITNTQTNLICAIFISSVEIIINKLVQNQRGSYMVWEINMGVSPRLELDNIMLFNCLGYDFYIYGAFEFLCNSIANLWRHEWYHYNT